MGMSLDFEVDLEKGRVNCDEFYTKSLEKPFLNRSLDDKPEKTGEESVDSTGTDLSPVQCKSELGRNNRKEKRSKSASKPPRPPRGPSLDAADQKLIREIAELAMLKRARIERMKALKKTRAAKSASSAASSIGNVLASLFTAIFFFVLVFQGLSPGSSGKTPVVAAGGATNGGLVSVQYAGNPASEPGGAYNGPVLSQRLPKFVASQSG